MKKRNLIIIGALFTVALIIYIIFSILVAKSGGDPLAMDVWARDTAYNIRGNKSGFGYWFWRIITETGNTYWVIVLVIVCLVYTRLDSRFMLFGIGVLLECILNAVFKGMYERERPTEALRWMYESSTSFPSGHSTTAGFVYTFIIYMMLSSNLKGSIKWSITGVSGALMIIVPVSRIILGMHYLSDCIAGLMLGTMTALVLILADQILKKYNVLQSGVIHFKKKK